MTDPATPGQEGPSYGPPSLPQGWIAQWDGSSKKYYFVQLSTGMSQWETPTQAAPTVGTPTPTPGHETSPFPQPGQQQDIGAHEIQVAQDGERGLGSMAMNQLLHSQGGGGSGNQSNPLLGMAGQLLGGGKHNQNQQSSPLLGMAGQLLGSGKHNQMQHSSNAGAGGIVGALAGSLLGGKTNQGAQQSYSGQPPQGAYGQHQDGLMGKLGGMFGGTSSNQPNGFGYSESGQHEGGYTGQAPPSSYQPAGGQNVSGYTGQAPASSYQTSGNQPTQSTSTYYNPQQPSYNQNSQGSPQAATTYYNSQQQQPYPPNSQSGPSSGPNHYYSQQQPQQPQQQPMYGNPQNQQQVGSGYGGQQVQPPYGSVQQQEAYPSPIYIGPASGNLPQPQHQMFQSFHNASHQGGLYGSGAAPQPPMESHPNTGQGYQASQPGQGGSHEMPGYGRGW